MFAGTRAGKAVERTSAALYGVGIIAIIAMMLHVSADVLSKWLLNYPLPWTNEIVSVYYMVAVIFLPLAVVSTAEGQIIIEVFTQHLVARKRAMVDLFAAAMTLLYLGILIYGTFAEAVHMTQLGEAWTTGTGDVPVWPARWMLPIGALAMALVVIGTAVDLLRSIRS